MDTGKGVTEDSDIILPDIDMPGKRPVFKKMAAEDLHNRGKEILGLGEYEVALRCFNNALKIEPSVPMVLLYKGIALYNLGKHKEAIGYFEEAIKANENFADAWHNKGAALYKLGNYKEAIECFERARDLFEKEKRARRAEIAAHFAAMARQTEQMLVQAQKPEPKQFTNKDAMKLYYEGNAFLNDKKYDKAIECYKKGWVLERAPGLLYNMGLAQLGLGSREKAAKCFEDAIPFYKKIGRLEMVEKIENFLKKLKAQHEYQAEVIARQKAALAKLQKQKPATKESVAADLHKRGRELLKLGQPKEAIKCFNDALNLVPNVPEVLLDKGNALLKLRDTRGAIECYAKAEYYFRKAGKTKDADNLLSWLKKQHAPKEATAQMPAAQKAVVAPAKLQKVPPQALPKKIAPVFENPGAKALFNRGNELRKRLALSQALECYRKALKIEPWVPAGLWGEGYVLWKLGNLWSAKRYLKKALRIYNRYEDTENAVRVSKVLQEIKKQKEAQPRKGFFKKIFKK